MTSLAATLTEAHDTTPEEAVRASASPLMCVVGPTASGKSALALQIAERFGGEIVSTDSMQVYRHLDIGTAKPSARERARIPHHLIDVVDPDEPFTAVRYAEAARAVLDDLARRGRLPVLCGGTGLYFRALTQGLAAIPPVPAEVRRGVEDLAAREGLAACYRELSRVDPESAARIHPRHSSRVLRALEVHRATGRPLSAYQRESPLRAAPSRMLSVGIAWERDALRERIAARVRAMLAAGWADEVRRVLALGFAPDVKPLRAIGYKEIVAMLRSSRGEAGLAEEITLRTRQYAKRQLTWFSRDATIAWVSPADAGTLLGRVSRFLESSRPGETP